VRRSMKTTVDAVSWRPRPWEWAVLAMGAAWVVDQCIARFFSWDGALYHAQAVMWASRYAVVPGIANLHGPLAFNNSSFLADAMVNSGWWEGRGFHVANGVLLLGAVLQAVVSGLRWLRSDRAGAGVRCFGFLMLALAFHTARDVASFSTDLPMALILGAAATLMYALLDRDERQGRAEDAYDLFALALLLAAAVSIKLTAAVFAAVALPVVIVVGFRHWPKRERALRRSLIWMAVVLAVFSGAWIARGIVMSGYPFFPLTMGGVPVDWRVPLEHAQAEVAYITLTERAFSWGLVGRNWVWLTMIGDVTALLVPGGLAMAALVARWFAIRRRRGEARAVPRTFWLYLPLMAAIAVWFVTAPSHRYSPALFWPLAALSVTEAVRVIWPLIGPRSRGWLAVLVVTIAVAPVFAERGFVMVHEGAEAAMAVRIRDRSTAFWGRGLSPMGGEVAVTVYTTRSGDQLNVPDRSRPPAGLPNACWSAPLPCTPNPAPNLQLRVPGRLDRGFRVQGGWEMTDWPYYWHAFFLPEWRARR